MKKTVSVILAFSLLLAQLCIFTACGNTKLEKYTEYYFDYFDTATTIVGYEKTQEDFKATCEEIKEQLNEYHKLFDIYNRYEGLNNLTTVNDLVDGEHIEVEVDKKIIDMLTFAKEMYVLTDGAVNVAMGSVLKIWHSYRSYGINNPAEAELPPMDKLQTAAEHTNIEDVIIDTEKSTVYLADSQMTLDVGAIAKGYAAEMVAQYLEAEGKMGYIINLGGNVRTVGQADEKPWNVGIENPDTDNEEKPYIEYLHLQGESLVTSGSYQRFYIVNGESYHHIIDSDTLMPSVKFKSVSVLTRDSGLGDALSTALFLMDYGEGLELVEAMENVEAMWVLPNGEQKYSSGFKNYTYIPE